MIKMNSIDYTGFINNIEHVGDTSYLTINDGSTSRRIPFPKRLEKEKYLGRKFRIYQEDSGEFPHSAIEKVVNFSPRAKKEKPTLFSNKKTIFPMNIEDGVVFENNFGFLEKVSCIDKKGKIIRFVTVEKVGSEAEIHRSYELRGDDVQDSKMINREVYNSSTLHCKNIN